MEDDKVRKETIFRLILKTIKNMPLSDKMLLFGTVCMAIGTIGLFVTVGILIADFGVIQVCIYTCLVLMGIGYVICDVVSERKYRKKLYE